jgi:HK97 family phage major capsid protein
MTYRTKYKGHSTDELKAAYRKTQAAVDGFKSDQGGVEKLTDEDYKKLNALFEEQDYLKAQITLASPQAASTSRSMVPASRDPRAGLDFAEIGRDFQAMIAASAPADFNLPTVGGFPIGRRDERLAAMGSSFRAASTGLNETVPSEGGFVVGTDLENAIMLTIFADSPLLPLLRPIEISTNSNALELNMIDETSRATGSRWGGVRGYWLAEAATKTKSKPKLRQLRWELKKVAALVYMTDELLQDATAFGRTVFDAMAMELRFMIQDAVLNGTGAGQPQGILNSAALVTVAAEGGQAADTVVWENIKKMWARYIGGPPVWIINRDIVPELYGMSQAVGTGGAPVYLPANSSGTNGAARAPLNTLMGAPVIELEQSATLGDLGDIMLIDPLEYGLATKSQMVQTAMSIHVNFLQDETVLRSVARVDGMPGSQVITPFKGSATRSAFVALAAR